ncbi:MAG TPA: hypothetical protein VJ353_11665 [Xanthobacteraceae bacterium]|jgi:hypothetical protein|nr:hypothetical protein [Xanthobacteraceae bacterium]
MNIESLDKFEGISVAHAHLLDLVKIGSNLAAAATAAAPASFANRELHHMDFAKFAALQAVNSLLAAASAKCTLSPPPPVDIDMITDGTGALIYRCQHKTPHRWKLDGTRTA